MSKLFVLLFLGLCIALATASPVQGGPTSGFKQCKLKCGGGHLNPVCGTDEESYPNKQILECYKGCGRNVEFSHSGFCTRHLPQSQRH